MHIGVFILLLLSGERNFGVRLNKPYTSRIPMDIPVFTGTHADLLIVVAHKLITTTMHRFQSLYDCLLTIVVNISPYVKSLSMLASTKMLHLLDAFSTHAFLYANPTNYTLVFFILEMLNNMIQYQFDGNACLVYTVIRKRDVFFALLNLPAEQAAIDALLLSHPANTSSSKQQLPKSPPPPPPPPQPVKQKQQQQQQQLQRQTSASMDGAQVAREAEPGTLKASLAEMPSVAKMTAPANAASSKDVILTHSDDLMSPSSNNNTTRANTTNMLIDMFDADEPSPQATSASASPSPPTPPQQQQQQQQQHTPKSKPSLTIGAAAAAVSGEEWRPTTEWVSSWKSKLPLQTIMRLLQVLVPQVEKICLHKGLTDETEILSFLRNGTLVGLLPVPHPILIRKYQPNYRTIMWFRTYLWGVIYLRFVFFELKNAFSNVNI